MLEIDKIYEYLEFVAELVPAPFYWSDSKGRFAGINNRVLEAVGANSKDEVIGKSVYELYQDKEIADVLQKTIDDVMRTGKDCPVEDKIVDIKTRKIKYFSAIRAPLRNAQGKIIGIIGTSIDITAEKEAEHLRKVNEQLRFENQRLELEKETQKITAQLEEHKKFRKIADQMAHDLGSPLMALSVLTSSCAGIPEVQRNMLRESASRIRDIAGSLLNQYKPQEEILNKSDSDELLVYAMLEQLVMDKQYEYQELAVKFECEHTKNSVFSFIKADPISFKRMLSNLINNSVEAIENKLGKVTLRLDSDKEFVKIIVIDTGKGISQDIIYKIINNIPVTQGKSDGHGIGFSQIHETLNQSNGQLAIVSNPDNGTTITLTFPKISAPEWVADELTLNPKDIIVILDDDISIHGAWDLRFKKLLQSNLEISVKHYTQAIDSISFINSLNEHEKLRVFLLADYELLKQNLNGLQVIEQTKVNRSILVTSHYSDKSVLKHASHMNTKILPKLLASEIKINIIE